MVLIFKEDVDVEELEENVRQIKDAEDKKEALDQTVAPVKEKIQQQFGEDENLKSEDINKWLDTQYGNEVDILKDISKNLSINLTEASNYITPMPVEPIISDKNMK